MAVIGNMAAILIYERWRMREIEAETANINFVRCGINTAHRCIMGLATLGEGVASWNKADYLYYRKRRNAYLGNILESSRHITRLANSLLEFLSSLIGQDRTMDNHSPDFEALYVTTEDERWTLETLTEESNRNSSDLLDFSS